MDTSGLRVLRVISRLNVGGPAFQISILNRNLGNCGVNTLVVAGHCAKSEKEFLDDSGNALPFVLLKGLGPDAPLWRTFNDFFKLRGLIKSFQPNIVHTHTFKGGLVGRLAAFSVRPKPRTVHTFHGHLLYGYFGFLGTFLLINIEKNLARKTDSLVAVGKKVRDELLEKGIGTSQKFNVVMPGVRITPPGLNTVTRKDLHIPKDASVITWIGRLTKIKRPELVFEICQLMSGENDHIHFLVAGGGELYETMLHKSLQVKPKVQILGWREDIMDLIRMSDLVISTSDNEGTPISTIQSQLLGVPVIASNVGSVSEVIDNNITGFLVPNSPEFFVEKIRELLNSKELLMIMSREAKERSSKKFDVSTFTQSYLEIYQSLVR